MKDIVHRSVTKMHREDKNKNRQWHATSRLTGMKFAESLFQIQEVILFFLLTDFFVGATEIWFIGRYIYICLHSFILDFLYL